MKLQNKAIKPNITIVSFFIIEANLIIAKLRIFRGISKKYFEVIDTEDSAVAYLAALAGGKYLHVSPAAVERVAERNDVTQFQNFPC